MAFHYCGRGGVPGFRGNPVRAAWQTFVTTVVWLVQILLQALAVLVPLGIPGDIRWALADETVPYVSRLDCRTEGSGCLSFKGPH